MCGPYGDAEGTVAEVARTEPGLLKLQAAAAFHRDTSFILAAALHWTSKCSDFELRAVFLLAILEHFQLWILWQRREALQREHRIEMGCAASTCREDDVPLKSYMRREILRQEMRSAGLEVSGSSTLSVMEEDGDVPHPVKPDAEEQFDLSPLIEPATFEIPSLIPPACTARLKPAFGLVRDAGVPFYA
eukprot:3332726-Amphidinium_carterae.1